MARRNPKEYCRCPYCEQELWLFDAEISDLASAAFDGQEIKVVCPDCERDYLIEIETQVEITSKKATQ